MAKLEERTLENRSGIEAIVQSDLDEVENCDSFLAKNKYF